MNRVTLLAGGAVAAGIVLAAGAVTVASAVTMTDQSSRVLDDHGVDTSTVSPTPVPSGSSHATPEPGDDNGRDGVVTVPPAGPTVIDRHGDPNAPDDNPGAHDRGGHHGDDTRDDHGGDRGGSDDGSGSGHGGSGR